MNVNLYNTTDYENKSNWTLGENKPNSKPNKANFKRAKMNITSATTVNYINELRTTNYELIMKNKPNSKPILRQRAEDRRQKTEGRRQMKERTVKPGLTKDYDKKQRTINNERYSKQSQSKPILERMNVNFCAAGYYESKPATCACATCGEANTGAGIRVAGKQTFAANNPKVNFLQTRIYTDLHRYFSLFSLIRVHPCSSVSNTNSYAFELPPIELDVTEYRRISNEERSP